MMTFEITNPKANQRLKVGGKDFDDVVRTIKILFDQLENNEVRYRIDRSNHIPKLLLHIRRKEWIELCAFDDEAKKFIEDALLLIDKPIGNDIKF